MKRGGLIVVIGLVAVVGFTVVVGALEQRDRARKEIETEQRLADLRHKSRLEAARALIDKPIEKSVEDARLRERERARQEAQSAARAAAVKEASAKQESYAKNKVAADQRCRYEFTQSMAYLEPVSVVSSSPAKYGPGIDIRYEVRLADSFRKDSIGMVDCSVDDNQRFAHLTKVRM